jgi:hypothetical protein
VIVASLHEYLPLGELARIVLVCLGVAIVAPGGAALVISGFGAQADGARGSWNGELRVAAGVLAIGLLILAGIYALVAA